MTHDYQPWTGELAVQPVPCPCCGSPAKVWQYVEKPDADVLRVVMCDGGAFQEERLPMLLDVCLLDMPPDAFYCQTARQAVGVWNLYAESLNARRAAIAGAAPKAEAGELQPVETIRYWLNAYSDPADFIRRRWKRRWKFNGFNADRKIRAWNIIRKRSGLAIFCDECAWVHRWREFQHYYRCALHDTESCFWHCNECSVDVSI